MIYLLILTIVGIVLAFVFDNNHKEGLAIFSGMLGLVCGLFFLIGSIAITVNSNKFIRKYKSTQQTISNSGRGTLENAALTMKVIECNQEQVEWSYWNSKWHTGFLISNDIETLEPIK